MIPGLTAEQTRRILADVIETHELVRQHGTKWDRKAILPYLPVAASSGLLFAASSGTRIVGMSIMGPTNKPEGTHNFSHEGKLLFCYFWLVHPDYRAIKVMKQINEEMRNEALHRFPWTERFCYHHWDRYVEKAIRGKPCVSEEETPPDSDLPLSTPTRNSRSLMKAP